MQKIWNSNEQSKGSLCRQKKIKEIRAQGVLTPAKEEELEHYLQEMVRVSCPLNITQLIAKVVELTQTRWTPFTNGIPEKSWIKWFKNRHHDLVLRVPKGLDLKRAKALGPQNVERFYENWNSTNNINISPFKYGTVMKLEPRPTRMEKELY